MGGEKLRENVTVPVLFQNVWGLGHEKKRENGESLPVFATGGLIENL